MSDSWNPLDEAEEQDEIIKTTSKKRTMQNILRSYVGFYDPFAELVQNAMDAVDSREREFGPYQKALFIRIDLLNNLISVSDNGIGFQETQFKTFLCPNISYKDGNFTRGKKGVGATYLGYGFNFLQMATKTPEYSKISELREGRKWLEDTKGLVPSPKVDPSQLIHTDFNSVDRGSSFTLRLGGDSTRPRDLGWVGATTAEQWRYVLLVKTPLGHVKFPDDPDYKSIRFNLEVIDAEGNKTSLVNQDAVYVFPHTVLSTCVDISLIVAEQKRLAAKQSDTSKLPDKFRKLNAVYGFWNSTELLAVTDDEGIKTFIDQFKIKAYGFFGYSVKLWDQFNDIVAKLRKGRRILRGGLQLATDHMTQGELLIIPLSSNIGYQNQSHVIVHFEKADPDLGRKGFQPELREAAEKIAAAIVNRLKKWRHLLRADTGAPPSIISESELTTWINAQEAHEKALPLKISNPNFFHPLRQVSITAVPMSEQDVIVLFNQLIAGGVIRGIRLLATGSHTQYDGIFRFNISEPLDNHIFDRTTNPLGMQTLAHDKSFSSKPYVLEYKFNIDALIQDFENEEKHEHDITLAVAWVIGEEWQRRYSVTSLLNLENLQHRPFHGVTHIFRDERTGDVRFYGVILSELIDYLNDVPGIQDSQKTKYDAA